MSYKRDLSKQEYGEIQGILWCPRCPSDKGIVQNKIDTSRPRVVLNHTIVINNYTKYPCGIIYLATACNYDKIEWYRTLDRGNTWQLLIGIRDEIEFEELYTKSFSYIISDGSTKTGSYVDYDAGLGEFFQQCTTGSERGYGDIEWEVTSWGGVIALNNIIGHGYHTKNSPNFNGYLDDDRNPHLKLFQFGELEANFTIGGEIVPTEAIDSKALSYKIVPTPYLKETTAQYGINTDRVGLKCRVYNGAAWVESDLVLANGTVIKNGESYQPPKLNISFSADWEYTEREPASQSTYGYVLLSHNVVVTGTMTPTWQSSSDGQTWTETASAYAWDAINCLALRQWGTRNVIKSVAKRSVSNRVTAYECYIRCVSGDDVSNVLHIVCEDGQENPQLHLSHDRRRDTHI